jgi:hypothetical protein
MRGRREACRTGKGSVRTSRDEDAVAVGLMSRRPVLPDRITIEQIAAALEAITSARVSFRATYRIKGTDVPASGEGLVDFTRQHWLVSVAIDGRQEELLTIGRDVYQRLPASVQQATGKLWLWVEENDSHWNQVIAAMPHVASCTGISAEILAGEAVDRYSFLLKPRNTSQLTALRRKEDPSVAELYGSLRADGRDRVFLDVWVAADHTVRKVRHNSAALELALLDGVTPIAAETAEYWELGVRVDFAAPSPDQVLGYPETTGDSRGRRPGAQAHQRRQQQRQ